MSAFVVHARDERLTEDPVMVGLMHKRRFLAKYCKASAGDVSGCDAWCGFLLQAIGLRTFVKLQSPRRYGYTTRFLCDCIVVCWASMHEEATMRPIQNEMSLVLRGVMREDHQARRQVRGTMN